jgi:CDP-diacylglycerol---serine O-phosphatidyltransferase
MKHLPNILTVGNLFCGCLAIAFILFNPPFGIEYGDGQFVSINGNSNFFWGAMFIGFAGLCDWLDGAAARWLGVESALGADLDSLSDVVSFGVAPSMIVMKLLWVSFMGNAGALDTSMFAVSPAFLIACFASVRLARFNNAPKNNDQFTGVPVPAIGIFIAGIALIVYRNELGLATFFTNKWVLYAIIAFCCWAMLSSVKLFTLKIKNFTFADNWGRYVWLLATLLLLPFLKFATVPISFILYIIISFFYKPNTTKSN